MKLGVVWIPSTSIACPIAYRYLYRIREWQESCALGLGGDCLWGGKVASRWIRTTGDTRWRPRDAIHPFSLALEVELNGMQASLKRRGGIGNVHGNLASAHVRTTRMPRHAVLDRRGV